MKRVLSLILILALVLSLCVSTTAFAADDANLAVLKERFPNCEVTTGTNKSGVKYYKVDNGEGMAKYYTAELAIWGLAENIQVFQNAGISIGQEGLPYEEEILTQAQKDPFDSTQIDGYKNYVKATGERNDDGELLYKWIYNINPFTGERQDRYGAPLGTYCSKYNQIKDLLVSNYPGEGSGSGSGGGGGDDKDDKDATKNPEQMINFYATGANSYTVTLPTQYSTSTADGITSLSGVFTMNVNDVVGDGTYYARLRVVEAENTEKYWLDGNSDDKTHYTQQNAENTLTYYEDLYLVNSDADAKICYELYENEINPRNIIVPTSEPLGLENVVISKQFTTTAADFGPFETSTTLVIMLDPYDEGLDHIPHGTYKDILTFQSSIEAAS